MSSLATKKALIILIAIAAAGCTTVQTQAPAPISQSPQASTKVIAKPVAPSAAAPSVLNSVVVGSPNKAPAANDNEPAVVVAEESLLLKQETDLWVRIRKGFAMPDLATPLVAEKEKFYTSKPEYLQRMFVRGNRYLYHIVEEVEKRGLPTELALLPFVESAMNPVALSSAKAAGLWQFMPATGKAYDLKQNWWVDNRRDVVHSTRAALDYLQKIYAMHGNDWFLALASYNWGEGAVGRAVKKNVAAGKPGNYLSLDMPNETRHYIPKLIAIKNIIANSQAAGVALPELLNRPYFVTIEKTRPIDLKLAAQFAGMSVDEFVALNPAHNRPVIAASKNNEIKLPADKLQGFIQAVEAHTEAQKVFASWQPHTMQAGETLETLAQRGGVSVAELRKANGLKADTRIVAGTRLITPSKSVADESKVEQFVAPRVYEQIDRAAAYHTVGKKETLASIAGRYGVSVANLHSWNGAKSGKRGQKLLVRPASTQTLLTTETGERSVVNNFLKTTYKPALVVEEPEAKPKAKKLADKKIDSEKVSVKSKAEAKTSLKTASKTDSKKVVQASSKGATVKGSKTPTNPAAKVTQKSDVKKASVTKKSDGKKKA